MSNSKSTVSYLNEKATQNKPAQEFSNFRVFQK